MTNAERELRRDKVISPARALSNWLLARTGQPSESFALRQAIKDYDALLAQPKAAPQGHSAAEGPERVDTSAPASAAPDSGMLTREQIELWRHRVRRSIGHGNPWLRAGREQEFNNTGGLA